MMTSGLNLVAYGTQPMAYNRLVKPVLEDTLAEFFFPINYL